MMKVLLDKHSERLKPFHYNFTSSGCEIKMVNCLRYYFLDKLTKNLVKDAIEWDRKDNLDKAPSQRTNNHLQSLVKCISSCGVSFCVWEKKDGDGKGSGIHDFTSLMGSDKKLLLRILPEKLPGVIRPETSATVVKLWKVFTLYSCLFVGGTKPQLVI